MIEYSVCLDVTFEARDDDEVDQIVKDLVNAIRTGETHPWKVKTVEANDLEEM